MDEETLAFEELSKLSVNDSTTSIESSLKKENFNVVFVGHVGKIFFDFGQPPLLTLLFFRCR